MVRGLTPCSDKEFFSYLKCVSPTQPSVCHGSGVGWGVICKADRVEAYHSPHLLQRLRMIGDISPIFLYALISYLYLYP